MEAKFEYEKIDLNNRITYYTEIFKSTLQQKRKYKLFNEAFQNFINDLVEVIITQRYESLLKDCLKMITVILSEKQDLNKINQLLEVLETEVLKYKSSNEVEFYYYAEYEELVMLKSYCTVLTYEILGEGAQVKRLLIKKLRCDESEIYKNIANKLSISVATAKNYLGRSHIPYVTFHNYFEDVIGEKYEEIIISISEQFKQCCYLVSSNKEYYLNENALEKMEYFLKRSYDYNDLYGEAFAKIYKAIIKFSQSHTDCWIYIDEANSIAQKLDVDLLTLAVAEKGYMFSQSGRHRECIALLEQHRRKLNNHKSDGSYIGSLYYHLGISYRKIKDYKKAKRYAKLSYNYALTNKMKAIRVINWAIVIMFQGKYAESVRVYRKVFGITARKPEMALAYNNIANTYIQIKEYDKAYENIQNAIALFDGIDSVSHRINYYDTLFEIILLSEIGFDEFHEAFDSIEALCGSINHIYENPFVVTNCLKNIMAVISKYKAYEYTDRFMKLQFDIISDQILPDEEQV